jgi:hypothetical protein
MLRNYSTAWRCALSPGRKSGAFFVIHRSSIGKQVRRRSDHGRAQLRHEGAEDPPKPFYGPHPRTARHFEIRPLCWPLRGARFPSAYAVVSGCPDCQCRIASVEGGGNADERILRRPVKARHQGRCGSARPQSNRPQLVGRVIDCAAFF